MAGGVAAPIEVTIDVVAGRWVWALVVVRTFHSIVPTLFVCC